MSRCRWRSPAAPRPTIKARVDRLLDLVGLADKRDALSVANSRGGQKQRVGIARALATRPKRAAVATRRPPRSTRRPRASILDCSANINRELGLTIVLITHEMDVVKAARQRSRGHRRRRIVEQGACRRRLHRTRSIRSRGSFLSPTSSATSLPDCAREPAEAEPSAGGRMLVRLTFAARRPTAADRRGWPRELGIDVNMLPARIDEIARPAFRSLVVSAFPAGRGRSSAQAASLPQHGLLSGGLGYVA